MEKYIINGVEVEYDTLEVENMAIFDSEGRRIADFIKGMKSSSSIESLREYVEQVHDFFDTVIGEGTSEKVFHGKNNVKEARDALMKFFDDVSSTTTNEMINVPTMNREQKRAAERQKRRADAAIRARETEIET